MRVSVVIPTRDRSSLLREALTSVRALEGADLTFEIIVVNDGSSDDTAAVAREMGAVVVEVSPPCSPRGKGTAAARNAGLGAATGEFVAFLDDDDVWSPQHIRPHVKLLHGDTGLISVFGQVINTDEDRVAITEPWPPEPTADGDVLPLLFRYTVQIGAFVSRISVRDSIGRFDVGDPEAYDWDWCFRLSLHGAVGFVPVPSVLFRQRTIRTLQDATELRRNARNSAIFLRYALRAGRRRPPVLWLARTHLRYRGQYYASFARAAEARACSGDWVGARKALWNAALVSPLHALIDLRRPSPLRHAVAALCT
jgi:glycosyltransferase involved in cell wall biosynthesis